MAQTWITFYTFNKSTGERSILATSRATLPWPNITAVSPERSGFNWRKLSDHSLNKFKLEHLIYGRHLLLFRNPGIYFFSPLSTLMYVHPLFGHCTLLQSIKALIYLTFLQEGSPLYQPTNPRAERTPGRFLGRQYVCQCRGSY